MPLASMIELADRAMRGGYALGYFESWDLSSLEGVIDAAEATRSPVVIGFNGEFLSRPGREEPERLPLHAALGRSAADTARVPCAFIFNECPDDQWTRQAIRLGFNVVMPVPGDDTPATYADRVAEIARLAHEGGVAVEAELGELPHGDAAEGGATTDPEQAAEFVAATGIDLLAVSVGNVHIMTRRQKELDLSLLGAIRRRVEIPLVLHGGTGIPRDSLGRAISAGVAKVNYGTYLKQRYLTAVRRLLPSADGDPHRALGLGGSDDILVAGRRAVREAVIERIDWLGCAGRA